MKKKMTGFTLVELLVALAVMAILVAIAAPAFQNLLERQRLEGVAETFLSDLRAARADALVLGLSGTVTVTINDGSSWTYTIVSSGNTPTVSRTYTDYGGAVTAAVTGWNKAGSTAAFTITSVRDLDSSGTGSITFTLGSLSARIERNLLGGVFVCSANGDLGYVTCS
ncbi:prepilin-type N-terminal cleavage/methylation domain-containing protein [Luminiphilus sp.]|nr:prepilin-type N-terminal cleavage/methylation domain-containing protein [Luminiphilus sp.]